jgi:gamma-glutamylputrescine oxidase
MLSGRSTTWARNPRRYVRALQADIKKTYPQLGEVAVDYAWAGTLGNTVHRMPQIGELGSGVWLASGFGGSGLNTSAMAGNLIARAIVEGDQTWRQFSPFELVWAGGVAGRVAIQLRSWIMRFRDRVAERRAHARELAHRQAREAELLAQEAVAQAEAAQNAVAEETPRYAEPGPLVATEAAAAPEPPSAGRHRAKRRKRRERREEVG